MMMNFLLVERKNDDDFFNSLEEKRVDFFSRFYSCVLPLIRLLKIVFTKLNVHSCVPPLIRLFKIFFLQMKIFIPVYPH